MVKKLIIRKPGIKVFWDLYGSTNDEDEIVKLKRVTI